MTALNEALLQLMSAAVVMGRAREGTPGICRAEVLDDLEAAACRYYEAAKADRIRRGLPVDLPLLPPSKVEAAPLPKGEN